MRSCPSFSFPYIHVNLLPTYLPTYSPLGQLLVWEWQSETYVLKQQGHADVVNTVAFSPDGQVGR